MTSMTLLCIVEPDKIEATKKLREKIKKEHKRDYIHFHIFAGGNIENVLKTNPYPKIIVPYACNNPSIGRIVAHTRIAGSRNNKFIPVFVGLDNYESMETERQQPGESLVDAIYNFIRHQHKSTNN